MSRYITVVYNEQKNIVNFRFNVYRDAGPKEEVDIMPKGQEGKEDFTFLWLKSVGI